MCGPHSRSLNPAHKLEGMHFGPEDFLVQIVGKHKEDAKNDLFELYIQRMRKALHVVCGA